MTARHAIAVIALVASLAVAACQDRTDIVGGVTIYRYPTQAGVPTALVNGVLRIQDGCTFVELAPSTLALVLWPADARLDGSDARVRVSLGGMSAGDGESVRLGGGEYSTRADAERLVGPIAERCVAPTYWLASTITRTSPAPSSS
jgi:hypothetical protein